METERKRGRQRMTDKEKRAVIDAHIEEYRKEVLNFHPKSKAQWDALQIGIQYNRIKGWQQRKRVQTVENADDVASALAHIDGMTTADLIALAERLQAYQKRIEEAIKANRQKDIESKQKEIDAFKAETANRLQELESELEELKK